MKKENYFAPFIQNSSSQLKKIKFANGQEARFDMINNMHCTALRITDTRTSSPHLDSQTKSSFSSPITAGI